MPNLVTEAIQHFYATAISFDVETVRYRTIFTDSTWQMECYNGFIIIAGQNVEVLFLEVKNNWKYENVNYTHIQLLVVQAIHGFCIHNRNFLGLDIAQPSLYPKNRN